MGSLGLEEEKSGEKSAEKKEDFAPQMTRRPQDGPQERCINSITLLGRVGGDPQIRGTEEKPITTFSLATNTTWKAESTAPGDSEWTHRTDWHNYVTKGARIHVTGRIIYGEVTDKTGVKRHTTSIAAEDIIYVERKQ